MINLLVILFILAQKNIFNYANRMLTILIFILVGLQTVHRKHPACFEAAYLLTLIAGVICCDIRKQVIGQSQRFNEKAKVALFTASHRGRTALVE